MDDWELDEMSESERILDELYEILEVHPDSSITDKAREVMEVYYLHNSVD